MSTYIIQQKIQLMINQYKVFKATAEGELGEIVAFAEQKRFAFREKFTLFADESKKTVLFEVQARQVMDFGARYDVRDASGNALGVIGKAFGASLFKSTWHIYQPGGEKPHLIVKERNATLAIVRRLWELLPLIGDIPFFVKYHFDFVRPETEEVVATYNKTTTFKDHYRLEVEESAESEIDWRVFVAMGVMLDALQSR